jgi:tetratricopeptide (TPR) repeat protein
MTPWDDPGYLKRVWCIFEMYSADVNEDTNIQIIMPPSQKNSLMTAVMKPTDTNGRSGLDELFQTLSNTKIENANASKLEDKINILKIVEEGPGCANFNNVINHLLRQWIRDTVFESANKTEAEIDVGTYSRKEVATYLTFCASFFSRIGEHRAAKDLHQKGLEIYKSLSELGEDPEEIDELTARCYNNIGTESESLAEYDEALENHHKCREIFEKIYGKVHENTSVSYFNIGAVLRKLERNEEALEMYEKSLEIDTKIKGANHIDVALSYSYIGRIKQNNEDYDGALELFEKSMKIRVDTYGKDHPDAAIGYGDLGLLNHMLGKYDEAISMHLAAMEIQEKVLGNLHPDTASVYQNIGGAYYEKKSYDKALEYHAKAKGAYETTFGYDHPKSVISRQWIDIVQDAIEEEKN